MPPESRQARRTRAGAILDALAGTYPEARCELDHANPLELLVATILSARCTDRQVNRVTRSLFARYRTARDYARADPSELEDALRQLGLFRNKARHIRECCRQLEARHGGEVPRTMEDLVVLPGVGRKTANVVLGNAFGLAEGIVVDTHVTRLSRRLGLARSAGPEAIERELQGILPRERWIMASHWLIRHGRRRCDARRPDCAACEVLSLCPTGKGDVRSNGH